MSDSKWPTCTFCNVGEAHIFTPDGRMRCPDCAELDFPVTSVADMVRRDLAPVLAKVDERTESFGGVFEAGMRLAAMFAEAIKPYAKVPLDDAHAAALQDTQLALESSLWIAGDEVEKATRAVVVDVDGCELPGSLAYPVLRQGVWPVSNSAGDATTSADVEVSKGDAVAHPSHYTSSPAICSDCGHSIECIDITQHMGFNLGNATKYIWRCDLKNDAIEDLHKARQYLDFEIEKREREQRKSLAA